MSLPIQKLLFIYRYTCILYFLAAAHEFNRISLCVRSCLPLANDTFALLVLSKKHLMQHAALLVI